MFLLRRTFHSPSLRRSSTPITNSIGHLRHFSTSGDGKRTSTEMEDMELQASYDGLMPRILTLSTILDTEGQDIFDKVKQDSIIAPDSKDSLGRQLMVFMDSQVCCSCCS